MVDKVHLLVHFTFASLENPETMRFSEKTMYFESPMPHCFYLQPEQLQNWQMLRFSLSYGTDTTYNGDKKEACLGAYKKIKNVRILD